jgi:protein involved in polysaccharide export with SLBB domain/transcription antitermination factor NusG
MGLKKRSRVRSRSGDSVEKILHQDTSSWYAVSTRSRQEKIAACMLEHIAITKFLPLLSQERQWSDRKQMVAMPLFPGYVFVRIARSSELQLRVLKVPGVVDFVRNRTGPLSIPDAEIEAIRALLCHGVGCSPYPFLKAGDRVRVVRGPLAGIEGTLIRCGSQAKLVLSIEMIQRSVSAIVPETDIEPIAYVSEQDPPPSFAVGGRLPLSEERSATVMSAGKMTGSALVAMSLIAFGSISSLGQSDLPLPPAAGAAASAGTQPQLQQRYPRYVIQRSDVLLLTFPLTPEFNQTVTVQPDGYVNLQNSGSVHVQGLTVPEMVAALQEAYRQVLHDPIINVDLVDFQKPFFTVSGQVGKPGQYELRADTTVAEALAVAGGMAPTAKTQVFLFHRSANGWFAVREVNLKKILSGKDVAEDASLQNGDMIYVPEKFIANFRKYVPYSLNAGAYLQQNPF